MGKVSGVSRQDLVVGHRYRIELDDCCIEGRIHEATFKGFKHHDYVGDMDPHEWEHEYDSLLFDVVTIDGSWWGCKFHPLEAPDA